MSTTPFGHAVLTDGGATAPPSVAFASFAAVLEDGGDAAALAAPSFAAVLTDGAAAAAFAQASSAAVLTDARLSQHRFF